MLLLADGVSARAVATKLEVSRPTIAKWRRRFLEGGVDGLTSHYTGRVPWKLTARVRARVLAATRRPPPDGTTHWSCRRLAAHLGVGKDVVQRVWREADLRPHRLARYMASNDPDFETKAADVIGLYLDPPRHAAVFCVDEKTAIQALDRRGPRAAALAGSHRAARVRVQATRHAVALRGAEHPDRRGSGQDDGPAYKPGLRGLPRRGGHDLRARSRDPCNPRQPLGPQDPNRGPRFSMRIRTSSSTSPRPISSWLNQVELWFSKVQRDVLSRGVFMSIADLARKLRRYIQAYAKQAKPFSLEVRQPGATHPAWEI